ncbi:MAG TPA: hydrogenase maturation protease [Terriglobales bacterium]|nr:hydrogenase maturation protease [Terriglobales bacterium]
MPQILVIGYGNPLRGDDGLGWTVAAELFRQNRSPGLEILPCHQLTPELVSIIREAETVVFIDCAHEGTPGELGCVEVQPGPSQPTFTHDLTPSKLLALTCELFGVCPKAYLLSICGSSFGPGETFSEAVTQGLADLRIKLHQLIDQQLGCAGARR